MLGVPLALTLRVGVVEGDIVGLIELLAVMEELMLELGLTLAVKDAEAERVALNVALTVVVAELLELGLGVADGEGQTLANGLSAPGGRAKDLNIVPGADSPTNRAARVRTSN